MIEIKTQYPYIDENGKIFKNLIRTYAEDKDGKLYYIIQNETNI